ncbi:hypothetical protein COT97_00725 [Candidatus Falkowbacteria bacterium CG10_big_fil_rev_8_21_14_0_10_39_11]|uniref:Methyltransferase domain-containing protein n=1 Tax=Candidatus Falkowbacteria bacterium CG10_big_fil_rev_8_21_14_0_10_39_11 TaxID=1974565 RepID=A0A2H0V661_9BACT|nr:MAG: hypothetical protein COT97_00725 [Candidatus Falkowbacteria bacterium CG10_big_fil_rev_8_21_14_0_10_39_11]
MNDSKRTLASYNKTAKEYVANFGQYKWDKSLHNLFIQNIAKGVSILDVGCGGGQDSEFFRRKGFLQLGIDPSHQMIKIAQKRFPKCQFKVQNIFSVKKSNFGGIWCHRVFHHISLKEQSRFLQRIYSLLKDRGVLFISVRHNRNDEESMIDMHETGDLILQKNITKKTFSELIKKIGFKIISKGEISGKWNYYILEK